MGGTCETEGRRRMFSMLYRGTVRLLNIRYIESESGKTAGDDDD